ncbi:MAG: hypothetical protein ACK5C8_01320 [Roseiflexaceae bacterium]|jgi:hypothetical protein|nr:hypothetical protein [Chloroflexaceae bacterium]
MSAVTKTVFTMPMPQLMSTIAQVGPLLAPQHVAALQQRRDEVIVPLRTLVAQRVPIGADDILTYARGHALVFLSSWRDSDTLMILLDVLRRHDDDLALIYELIECTVPAYGTQVVPLFAELLNDVHAPRDSRICASGLLSYMGHLHPLMARHIGKILRDALPVPDDTTAPDSELASWIVMALAELRSKSASPHVKQLYKAGVLDPSICGRPDEFVKALNDQIVPVVFRDPITIYQ